MLDDNQSPAGVPMDDLALELAEASGQTSNEGTASEMIPDKYRGKSPEELIAMHQNAERRMSQMGNELGEVRRLADKLIGVKATDNTARAVEPRKPVTVDALLADPESVLNQALESSPVAQKAHAQEQRLQQLELTVQQRDFVRSYPEHQSDMSNPAFMEWVNRNSLRRELAARAYNQDYSAASNLWSLWEEQKGSQSASAPADKQRVQAAKTQKGGSADVPVRTYSRSKLMELRAKVADGDPAAQARWNDEDFQKRLLEAYEKGLVK